MERDTAPSPDKDPGDGRSRPRQPGLVRSIVLIGLAAIALTTAVALGAGLALRDISWSARQTRDVHLPNILETQRTIINVERLGRYGEVVYHSPDRAERRNARLAAQILAQDSAMERNPEVYELVWSAFKNIRAVDRLRSHQEAGGERSAESEDTVRALREDYQADLAEVTDILSMDATAQASTLSTSISNDARRVTLVATAGALATLVLVAMVVFLFHRHIVHPILAATRGLEKAEQDESPVRLPRARIREMDAIGLTVERFAALLTQLKERNEELRRLSTQDGLTCIPNRRHFDAILAREIRRAARHQRPLSLILLDIDHFKLFNETYGHQAGDDCLRRVSRTLAEVVQRPGEMVARYGGEEFAAILPEVGPDEAMAVAGRMADRLADLDIAHSSSPIAQRITLSMGVATATPHVDFDPAELIAAADTALYRAKQKGRNAIHSAEATRETSPAQA